MKFILAAAAFIGLSTQDAQAYDRYGYSYYPSYYGSPGHRYRSLDYGGGLPYRDNGYHMADRPIYRVPSYRYDWRAVNRGRPGHEDWQHAGW